MRKNVLGISVLSTLLVASVVYASPMTEMKQGTGKIDASFSLGPSFKAEEYGWTGDMDGKTRGRLGITYGLGDKFGMLKFCKKLLLLGSAFPVLPVRLVAHGA